MYNDIVSLLSLSIDLKIEIVDNKYRDKQSLYNRVSCNISSFNEIWLKVSGLNSKVLKA